MGRIGFIDITSEPCIYIIEKGAGKFENKETMPFDLSTDYHVSMPETPLDIDEFYLSLPLSLLNFRLVEMPFSEKEKILSVLPLELDSIILGGASSVIFDGIVLGNADGKSNVLAVYAEKTALNKIIEGLRPLNIDPRVVTSLELAGAVKEFSPERLLNPVEMNREARIIAAMGEINNSTINLRRGELSYTKDEERLKKSLKWTAILGAAAILLFLLSAVLRIASAKKEIAAIGDDMGKIYSEIFPAEKKTSASLYMFRSRVKELKDKEGLLIGISPLEVLLGLSAVNKGNITFNEISLEKGRAVLKGEAASFSDVQQIRDALSKIMDEVNVSDSKTSVQGRILFSITAKDKKA